MNKEEYNYLQEILQLPSEVAADLLQSSDEESSSVASSAEEDVLTQMDRCATQ